MEISKNIKISLIVIGVLWAIYLLNFLVAVDLRNYGIKPHNIEGLSGIIFAPFLHANKDHLIANSGALLALLIISLSISRKITIYAVAISIFVGGGFVWIFSSAGTVHIGASGVIFGLIGFLMFYGIFRRKFKSMLLSLAVFVFYGGALYSLFENNPGISWTGHFFGFFSGVFAARSLRNYKT